MKKRKRDSFRTYVKRNKSVFVIYVVLRCIVIVSMIMHFLRGNYENCFFCLLTLLLFTIPSFIEMNYHIQLPNALEIIILLFIFAAEILGEIHNFYLRVPNWDTMLHTINGFLCAAIGFAMIDLLNKSPRTKFELSPLYIAVVAFCFSMTVGVLWEFFEFAGDRLLGFDMQKDTVVTAFTSVELDPTKDNVAVAVEDIADVIIVHSDGSQEALGLGGYLDIGIIDTMKDLFVNFVGAVVFSVIGYFYEKTGRSGKFARQFIPTVEKAEEE